ncbi:MAG: demethoxyubiquinone hydroxylase family protein [Lautropia sp.]|nr:MAG: 2-polyprenyl-3-methyl-6-methoxy-1,4-benzoquinone monooxygenase [Pseudomonadota bacterium]MBC6960237.1 demethoxyubiquinone hydroxylase family protein [Lautropia sp.]MCL4702656.1 2-polyprenyl-3-methyl-6-methoxy-1,4-benzoquinone monooxygenase [Burkholderiaceae bacterium]MDL1908028.1 2-polyprenyl-3-methyl-6-methoxy-1,4-benzoquinone monooxygenase [Betaproteobacteria bacterium PRO1]RIK89636.1 MAG: demethoxyubiquinone hydroxylase family protein [Burkholderiales bacterium]
MPEDFRRHSSVDRLLSGAGRALATLSGVAPAVRAMPVAGGDPAEPADPAERRLSGALMRVNHVGEICAQALYEGQAAATADPRLAGEFRQAAREEGDHLAWTRERLRELDARPSVLNPLWYGGALLLGLLAGRAGDRLSLGFMAETERQVEAHLAGHLERLPASDLRSRAIVVAMKDDEIRHAQNALRLGGAELPAPVRAAMRAAAKVMTTTAHHI